MTHTVVSVGCTRLLDGIGLGAVRLLRLAMVVAVVELVLTNPASGSVPVFTDHRSTPHARPGARRNWPREAAVTIADRRQRHFLSIVILSNPKKAGYE